MGRLTLIIGGARSGKSQFALKIGEKLGKDRILVATARATDPEMEARILKHKLERGPLWETFEEPLDVVSLLGSLPAGTHVVVIDCITVLLSNLMIEKMYEDEELLREIESLTSAIHESRFSVIAVANEVGMGLVPAEPLGRRFRDLAGMANQRLAEVADEVFLVTAGIPLCLKKGGDST
ncbi:MAG: bifunctional adenosylcobinamide kinase/adenosylcobinamide-phosphate guanylyltransferase [bacterium]